MNVQDVAIGVGVAAGAAAGIGASIYGIRAENRAAEQADADWAASRPDRQPQIDTANAFVTSLAERFGQGSAVHERNGLNTASIFDPDGEVSTYLRDHKSEIPPHVGTSIDGYGYMNGGYDGSYVKLTVTEPRREPVNTGAAATAAAIVGGGAAMGVGALVAKFAHGAPKAIGGALMAAGGAAMFTGLLGNVFMPESAIQW